jgi:hypothetical protein
MPIFALQKIEAIKGKQEFDKLLVDGKCPFDDFEKGLQDRERKEMAGIYNCMQAVADLRSLPSTKFHFYDDGENGVREFEFKSKNLRVYGITKKNGKIVIYGGTKANQVHDSAEFRRIKKLYLSSLT